jgi:heterodisulfide reductase subunit C
MTAPVLRFEPDAARSFAQQVAERSGQNLMACYQCRRCAAGCPVSEECEFVTPDRLIRMIVLGDREAALENELVWKCVSCYTCGTRCPNDIQTGRITETLKKMAKENHLHPLDPKVAHFHDAFVNSAARWGRMNEMEFMGFYEMKNSLNDMKRGRIKSIVDEMMNQAKLGLAMFSHKRLHFGFQTSKGRKEIKRLFKKAKKK